MPLSLNVGVTKKIGQPDYGSLGASCHLTLELDPTVIVNDLEGFHQRVRDAYIACTQAVNDELSRHSPPSGSHAAPAPKDHHPSNGGRRNGSSRRRPATESQCRAIEAIAHRQRLDLPVLLQDRFHVERAEDLDIAQASRLIDELKGEN